jgi:hypothetical protein
VINERGKGLGDKPLAAITHPNELVTVRTKSSVTRSGDIGSAWLYQARTLPVDNCRRVEQRSINDVETARNDGVRFKVLGDGAGAENCVERRSVCNQTTPDGLSSPNEDEDAKHSSPRHPVGWDFE